MDEINNVVVPDEEEDISTAQSRLQPEDTFAPPNPLADDEESNRRRRQFFETGPGGQVPYQAKGREIRDVRQALPIFAQGTSAESDIVKGIEEGYEVPAVESPEVTEQRALLSHAQFYKASDGTLKPFTSTDIDARYRELELNDGVALVKNNPDGTPIFQTNAQGRKIAPTVPLQSALRREEMLTGPRGPLPKVGGWATEAIASYKGVNNLKELDDRLKQFGMSEVGRTFMLDAHKYGALDNEKAGQGMMNALGFFVEIPDLARVIITKGITAGMDLTNMLLGDDKRTDESLATIIEKKSDEFSYDFPNMQQIVAEKYGMDIRVVRHMMQPQGFKERVQKLGPEYGSIYGALASRFASKSLKEFGNLEKKAIEKHGGETFGEAMENAKKKDSSYHDFKMEYLTEEATKRTFPLFKGLRQAAQERRIDTGLGLRVREPGTKDRIMLLKDNVKGIDDQIDTAVKELQIARNVNNAGAVSRTKKRIAGLNRQKEILISETLTPKIIRDMGVEFGWAVTGVAAVTEGVTQFFGNDPDSVPLIELGASLAVMMFANREGFANLGMRLSQESEDQVRNSVAFITGKSDFGAKTAREQREIIRNAKDIDKATKKTLMDIANAPRDFQQLFLAGAAESASIRRDLIKLSEVSGVQIDEDLFINTLGDVSGMGSLVTLSRNIDERIAVTGFDSAIPLLLQKEQVKTDQQIILRQMGTALQQLTRTLTATGNEVEGRETAQRLHTLLSEYIIKEQARIAQSEIDLQRIMTIGNREIESIHYGMNDTVTGGLDGATTLSALFDYQDRALKLGLAPQTLKEFQMSPTEILMQRAQSLDDISKQRADLFRTKGFSLTPEMASTGEASLHAAQGFVHVNKYVYNKANGLYNNFTVEADKVKARADISDLGFDIISNPERFVEYNPELLGPRTALLREGKKLTKTSSAPFNALLLDAAERSMKIVSDNMDQVKAGTYSKLIQTLKSKKEIPEEVELTSLDEFKMLTEFAESPQGRSLLPDGVPLLTTAEEWKTLRQHISNLIGQNPGNNQYFKTLKKEWDEVGNPESSRGWRTGWTVGDPQNVAQEVNAAFKTAQQFWETNIEDRYGSLDDMRKWNSMLTKKGVERMTAEGADRSTVMRELAKGVDTKDLPMYWLDAVFKEAVALSRGRNNLSTIGLPLSPNEIENTIERPLAMMFGVKDPADNRWKILVQDDFDPKNVMPIYGREAQRSVRLWLQAKLLNTKDAKEILTETYKSPSESLGRSVVDTLIRSTANLQVYKRNADGAIVPVEGTGLTPLPYSGTLVKSEEVFDVLPFEDLEAISKEDLTKLAQFKETFEDYKKQTIAQGKLTIKEIETGLNRDRRVAKQLGIDVDQALGNYEDIGKTVYGNLVGGGVEGGLSKLKDRVKAAYKNDIDGISELEVNNLVDDFIERYTLEHIIKTSHGPDGAYLPVYSEKYGQTMYMPSIGINHVELANKMGLTDPVVGSKVREIIGDDKYDVLESVVKVVSRMTQPTMSGISGRVPTTSMESLLSRGYNLNRNVVSPQYTALELVLRQSRQSGGRALRAMLNNPQLARRVLDELEAGNVPPEKSYPDIIRALTVEVIRQEASNEWRREKYGKVVVPFVEDERTPPPVFDEFSDLTQRDVQGPPVEPSQPPQLQQERTGMQTIDQLRALGFQL